MFGATPCRGLHSRRGPDDDFIVYLARENDTELIVSGDGDLLAWPVQQPPVMKTAEFERVLTRN